MHFQFEHQDSTIPFELPEGTHRLGGGPEDQVHLEGLPPALLTLSIEEQRLTVASSRTFTVNEVFVPPGVARLVLPGEVLGLTEQMCVRVLEPEVPVERGVGTVAVLKELLLGSEHVISRAATLTCLTGLDLGRTFAIGEALTDIGRGGGAKVRLRDRAVSRVHARIHHDADGFHLEDLGTANGVFLNGKALRQATPLTDGDVIELGRSLLRFQAPVDEPPAPIAEAPAQPAPLPPEPEAPAPPEPPAPPAAHPEPRRDAVEGWLLTLAATAALVGLLVTYALLAG
ncbi:FHA domain-containing protein [Corallococcus sp. H22C18031201]|uniref:FHA domain-containing protein n=1 Tax=Citreicoccus inhibens TaxID=2849499 RepID=UPI000E7669DF|nr:FHA domain-containing protein [Citreicoccus inhibens]MBU8898282.1 FHA domain-containing protein [Citreicoccus inhibens]RJS27010.1 FHA domain-containing protein [Corallococcus sp. H22C18031201]